MGAVLLDNWTLYDISYPSNLSFDAQMDNLENLLMSILLWDKVFFWDNGKTSLWKNESRIMYNSTYLQGIKLPQSVEYKVNRVLDSDVVAGGAKQYQLIAEELGCDYLPKRERYDYLIAHGYYNQENNVYPKLVVETVEESVQQYYDDLTALLRGTRLKFNCPLLVDYIRDQAGVTSDYISVALQMRETKALQSMRTWIDNLRNSIDRRNLIETQHMMEDVRDIVSQLSAPQKKGIRIKEISIHPLPPFVDIILELNPSPRKPKTQLAFLYNLVGHVLEGH